MVEVNNADELEAWQQDRPREDAVLIAARAALRVFPLLAPVVEADVENARAIIILPVCRALAVASFAGMWPKKANGLGDSTKDAALAASSAEVAIRADASRAFATGAHDALVAAVHAATAATNAANAAIRIAHIASAAADAANVASDAAIQAANADAVAANAPYAATSIDATLLEHGAEHDSFATRRLWPERFPHEIREAWQSLRDHLLGAGDDWFVWVDWYQDRLDGKPANRDLELAKALIPTKTWEAGPAILNAEIARLINEHARSGINAMEALRSTEPTALSDFRVDPDSNETIPGPMRDDPPPPEDPYRMRDHADRLSVLADLAKGLHRDFLRDQPQVPESLRLNLNDYAREAAKAPVEVRPRMLLVLGNRFMAALRDENIRGGLSNYLLSSLEGFAQEHQVLAASYYSAIAEAAQHRVKEVEAQSEEQQEELETATLTSADQIQELSKLGAPRAAAGFLADLRAEMSALREERNRLPLISDAAARQAGAKRINVELAAWSATQVRHVARIVEHVAKSTPAAVTSLFGTIWTIIEKILSLLP